MFSSMDCKHFTCLSDRQFENDLQKNIISSNISQFTLRLCASFSNCHNKFYQSITSVREDKQNCFKFSINMSMVDFRKNFIVKLDHPLTWRFFKFNYSFLLRIFRLYVFVTRRIKSQVLEKVPILLALSSQEFIYSRWMDFSLYFLRHVRIMDYLRVSASEGQRFSFSSSIYSITAIWWIALAKNSNFPVRPLLYWTLVFKHPGCVLEF